MYNLKLKQPIYNLCFINLQTDCTVILQVALQKLFLYYLLILHSPLNSTFSWSDF